MAGGQRAASRPPSSGVRLADLLAGLSLVSDLGMGLPPEDSLRSALVATGLARELGLPEHEVADVFYTALLQHVGCTAFAHETAAALGGDDRAVNAAGVRTNFADPRDMVATFLPELTRGTAGLQRVRLVTAALLTGSRLDRRLHQAICEVASSMAQRLGLGEGVQTALGHAFAWWNGKGDPRGVAGDDVPLPMRMAELASTAVLFHGLGGSEAAVEAVRARSGRTLDPDLVDAFARVGPGLLREAFNTDPADAVLTAEPTPVQILTEHDLDDTARAFGQVVDLKSPYLHGHADAVADLAEAAGKQLGLEEAVDGRLRLAGHLHDLGRAGVASGIWDKRAPLTAGEWDQVRLHAYHTERILSRSAALAPVAELAGMHHERCDGSGYHRGSSSEGLSMAVRVLGAADVFVALRQDRPHRDALDADAAAAALTAEAGSGRLDGDAVTAVLSAAGHAATTRIRREWPAGLTDRQVDVLRLVARGLSNREIAQELVISPRTAEHHVQDVYTRIGTSSRAAAAMFAMRHGLLS